MTEEIKVLYVDDNADIILSSYLKRKLEKTLKNEGDSRFSDVSIKYVELELDENERNIQSILNKPSVWDANLIIVDSRLYVDSDPESKKISGEAIKMLFLLKNPFGRVVIISQNEDIKGFKDTVLKYSGNNDGDADVNDDYRNGVYQYYNDNLEPLIRDNIEQILDYRKLFGNKIKGNVALQGDLEIEKIQDALDGDLTYNELTDDKIDDLIEMVERLEDGYTNG